MKSLRQRAVESYHVIPHGGLEIGGLLFGRVSPNARTPLRIEIAAERPIECAHHNGPAFLLTDEERAQIAAQLEVTRLDPEIAGLSVVGFWVSHSRGELSALSENELATYKIFPNAWQVVLVLKPEAILPTRATFFFRSGARVAAHDSTHEFFAESGVTVPTPAPSGEKYQPIPRDRRPHSLNPNSLLPAPATEPDPQLEPESQPIEPTRPRTVSLSLAAFLMMLSALIGASLTYGILWMGKNLTTARPEQIHLELFPRNAGVLIHWNPQVADIQNAHHGELRIQDSTGTKVIPLTLPQLQLGYLDYTATGPGLAAELTVIEPNGRVVKATGVGVEEPPAK